MYLDDNISAKVQFCVVILCLGSHSSFDHPMHAQVRLAAACVCLWVCYVKEFFIIDDWGGTSGAILVFPPEVG